MKSLTVLNIIISLLFFLNILILQGCLEEGGARKGRPLIEDYSAAGEVEATPEPTPSPTPAPPQRPTNDIVINSDFCVCAAGKNILNNNCSAFCEGASAEKDTLYATVTIGTTVEMFDGLGNLYNWCKVPIEGGNENPQCYLKIESENGALTPVNITANGDSFTVALDNVLMKNIRYRAKLIVTENGYVAETSSIQLYVPATTEEENRDGPLEIAAMARYACLSRAGGVKNDDGSMVYTDMIRQHFFIGEDMTPTALPPCPTFLICHDTSKGQYDNQLYPRLEYEPIAFRVWSSRDLRTYMTEDGTNLNINNYVKKLLETNYGITSSDSFTLFRTINTNSSPPIDASTCQDTSVSTTSTSSTSSTPTASTTVEATDTNTTTDNPITGVIMQPWIRDEDKSISFCPKQVDYNSGVPIMEILKDVVGVDTEGLFMANREPTTYTMPGNVIIYADFPDPLLISESTLTKIWFHYKDGKYSTPTTITAGQKPVMFYWPITDESTNTPFQQKSYQKLYTIKTQAEIEGGLEDRTVIQAKDKRIGCIPASAD